MRNFILKHKGFITVCSIMFFIGLISSWNNITKDEVRDFNSYGQVDFDELNTKYLTLINDFKDISTQLSELTIKKDELSIVETEARKKTWEDTEDAEITLEEDNNTDTYDINDYSSNNSEGTNKSNTESNEVKEDSIEVMVWTTEYGSKYHDNGNCGSSKYVSQISLKQAKGRGLSACKTCY